MKTKNNHKTLTVLLVIAIAVAVTLTALALTGEMNDIRLAVVRHGDVINSTLPSVSESERITDIPHGEIRFLINKNITFNNPFSLGNVMIENPEISKYDLEIIIYSSDAEELYRSPVLKPGQSIVSDKLSTYVKSGNYNCNYAAKAYSDGSYIGETSGSVRLSIG